MTVGIMAADPGVTLQMWAVYDSCLASCLGVRCLLPRMENRHPYGPHGLVVSGEMDGSC
jgi:hypothetical protein